MNERKKKKKKKKPFCCEEKEINWKNILLKLTHFSKLSPCTIIKGDYSEMKCIFI